VDESVGDALAANDAFEVTYQIVTADGTTKWVWERGRGVDADDGEPEVLEGFITDITECKEREEELQRTERRYRAIFEDPNILAGVLDTTGRFSKSTRRHWST
jgi:PAS domain-containing protein